MLSFFRRSHPQASSRRPPHYGLSFHPAPDVKASLHADGVVLIHHAKGTVFSANRVGAMIWKGITERWGVDRVAASISEEFAIPQQTVLDDTVEFLAQLEA